MHLNEESSQRGPPAATPADPAARRLALFDLDYTLLPIDSDYEWARFLVRAGVVDGAEYEQRNDEFFRQYHAGTLDIDEFLAFQLAPLGEHPPETLERWHDQFMDEVILPAIRDRALDLVRRHRDRGDLCAIVTATNEFVTAPIARAFCFGSGKAALTSARLPGCHSASATNTVLGRCMHSTSGHSNRFRPWRETSQPPSRPPSVSAATPTVP